MKAIIEFLGLDWLPYIFGKRMKFSQKNDPEIQSIREELAEIKSEKTDYGIAYCENLLSKQDERAKLVESKAFALLSITGVATGFITGLAGIFLENNDLVPGMLLGLIYFLAVFPFIVTILISMRVVIVGTFSYPSSEDILLLSSEKVENIKKERIASTYYSIIHNQNEVNKKVTFLTGAQLWFRNSIYVLFILIILISLFIGLSITRAPVSVPILNSTCVVSPTQQPTQTATSTLTPTNTPTKTIPPTNSVSPSATNSD